MLSFLDTVTASSLLKLVRAQTTTQAPVKGKKKENPKADDMEMDGDDDTAPSTSSAAATSECATIISNLADLFQHHGIRDQPDIARITIETLAQVTRLCTAGRLQNGSCTQLMLSCCCVAWLRNLHASETTVPPLTTSCYA